MLILSLNQQRQRFEGSPTQLYMKHHITHTNIYTILQVNPAEVDGQLVVPLILLLCLFLTCASSRDRPKLLMSILLSAVYKVLIGHDICLAT